MVTVDKDAGVREWDVATWRSETLLALPPEATGIREAHCVVVDGHTLLVLGVSEADALHVWDLSTRGRVAGPLANPRVTVASGIRTVTTPAFHRVVALDGRPVGISPTEFPARGLAVWDILGERRLRWIGGVTSGWPRAEVGEWDGVPVVALTGTRRWRGGERSRVRLVNLRTGTTIEEIPLPARAGALALDAGGHLAVGLDRDVLVLRHWKGHPR